jgi:hypothetical protein
MKTPENTEEDPDDPEAADEGDKNYPIPLFTCAITCNNLGQCRYYLIIQNII